MGLPERIRFLLPQNDLFNYTQTCGTYLVQELPICILSGPSNICVVIFVVYIYLLAGFAAFDEAFNL